MHKKVTMYAGDIILMSRTLTGLQKVVGRNKFKKCTSFKSDKTEFCISKGGHTTNYITTHEHLSKEVFVSATQ